VAALAAVKGGAGQVGAMNRQMYNQAQAAPSGNAMQGYLAMEGARDQESYEAGQTRSSVANVQRVAGQPMYRRGQVWRTADTAGIDLDRDQAQVRAIDRFTEEYFGLVRANSLLENQTLSRQAPDEQLLIRLRGQVYLIR
jgi:hypothetical protein